MITRSQINKAGRILVRDAQDAGAVELLGSWRLLHFEPMNRVCGFLAECVRTCPLDCDAEVVVSNRLKRSGAIIQKLRRQPTMDLSRMYDLAGIRLVLKTKCSPQQGLMDIGRLYEHCFSRLSERFKVRDKVLRYTDTPKESGYRAIHIVAEGGTGDASFPILPIEIQIRTEYQHLWAMAVETAGMFYGQALKSSEGSEEWLTFFTMCSAIISHLENGTIVPPYANTAFTDMKEIIKQYGNTHTFFQKMSNIAAAHQFVKRDGQSWGYCLLELNIRYGKSTLYPFRSDQFALANDLYTRLEQSSQCTSRQAYVVLISVDHLDNLLSLYPSYFLDVTKFMSVINDALLP